MRNFLLAFCAFVAFTLPARAGYKDCALALPEKCENSNQLIWAGPSKVTAMRSPLVLAIDRFLRGAPTLYIGKIQQGAAFTARNAITGPGDRRQLDGDWFFDGFWPHNATERAAIILDPHGKLLLVAILNSATDASTLSDLDTLSAYTLRIYSHIPQSSASIRYLQGWARRIVPGFNSPSMSHYHLVQTQMLVSDDKGHWGKRIVP